MTITTRPLSSAAHGGGPATARARRPAPWRSTIAAAVGAAVLLSAACTTPPAAPDTLRIGVYASTDFLPIYVMESKGIAARHRLALEKSKPFAGGLAAGEAIARDEVDVSYPGLVPLFSLAAAGQVPSDIAIVGVNQVVTPQAPAAAFLAGEGITRWSDLSGRQIGIHSTTSINAASFAARAKAEGVTDFDFVVIGFSDMGLAVRDGTVAGAVMEEPWTTQSLLRGDGQVLGWTQGEPPLERVPLTAIAVRAELLGRPEVLARFLRAHLEAVRFIRDNPAEARQLFVANLGVSSEVAAALHLKEWPLDARLDMAGVLEFQQILDAAGAATPPVDPATFYTPGPLDTVLGEG